MVGPALSWSMGEPAEDELARLRAAVASAEARLDDLRPSPQQLRDEAAEAERRALACGALSPKTSQLVQSMASRWCDFLVVHGDAYGYDPAIGPTIKLAVQFQTHGFSERVDKFSVLGEEGMSDTWGRLHVPYLLAKYVFPRLGYPGWVGLSVAALREKTAPYTLELRMNGNRLKQSHVRNLARVMSAW